MLGIGVLPVILAGLFALYFVTQSHNESVASIESNLISEKIQEVNRFIDETKRNLELVVTVSDLDKEFTAETRGILLNQLIDANSAIEEASFIDINTGREISRVSRAYQKLGQTPELRDESNLESFKKVSAALAGADNCKSEAGNQNYDYIGPVYFNASGPAVTIAAPVRNAANCAISILSAELNLTAVNRIAQSAALGKTGYVYIFDQSGRVIGKGLRAGDLPDNLSSSPITQDILSGRGSLSTARTQRYVSLNGLPVIAAGTNITGLGWGIVAEWPSADADSVLVALEVQIIIFSLIVFVLVLLLSVLLTNKIVGPIQQLEAGTEAVAKGKFDEPVTIKTGDEIEDLGLAFNKMTEGLKQLQALKDEFVFIAAHELKTPVAAIKGYLSIINDGLAGPVSDQVKGFITKVLNANARLIRLVEDLLEVARSDAGKIKVDVVKTDIVPVVNETLSELKPLADEKGIKMVYTPLTPTPAVMADNGRVREVLVNLIGNAIKYTVGNGSIEISHETTEKNLVTHIKDHGLGISKDAQAKLFTKFYRVATKDTANISGTGLGLFIVKQIIEKMNGTIYVESAEGQGSTFSFSLPLA